MATTTTTAQDAALDGLLKAGFDAAAAAGRRYWASRGVQLTQRHFDAWVDNAMAEKHSVAGEAWDDAQQALQVNMADAATATFVATFALAGVRWAKMACEQVDAQQ